MHGKKDIGLFIGVVGIPNALCKGVARRVDGECVALILVATPSVEVTSVGTTNWAGGET